jgi:lipopolysaccharide export system protein LptA
MMHKPVLAAAVLLQIAVPAIAQTAAQSDPPAAESTAPVQVDIEANQMEILESNKKAVFRGSVDATRGDTNLKSDELTVLYAEVKQPDGSTKTDATDLDAKGKVTITTARETITGDWAKFNVQENKLIMGGNVKLVQGSTVLTGRELHADLDTERIEMTGGRVKGSFLPQ